MDQNNIQLQIDTLNNKLDRVIEMLAHQQRNTEVVDDLVEDLGIVGKDAFQTAVNELSIRHIQVNGDDVKHLLFKLLANIGTFVELLELLESFMDFKKDIGPIIRDSGIAITQTLAKAEEEGVLNYLKELGNIGLALKNSISQNDLIRIREAVPAIAEIARNLTAPGVIETAAEASKILAPTEQTDTSSYSLFKLIRTMNKPEVRKTLTGLVRIMEVIGRTNNPTNKNS